VPLTAWKTGGASQNNHQSALDLLSFVFVSLVIKYFGKTVCAPRMVRPGVVGQQKLGNCPFCSPLSSATATVSALYSSGGTKDSRTQQRYSPHQNQMSRARAAAAVDALQRTAYAPERMFEASVVSTRSMVYVTVRCLSVRLSICLSQHGPIAANPLLQVCCCGPGRQDRLLHGRHPQQRRAAGECG